MIDNEQVTNVTIETERESFIEGNVPLEGDIIPAQMSERVFSALQGLTDYVNVFKVENGRFGTVMLEGRRIFVLQYQPTNQ